ncbi:hypothetical protein [Cryptosporangium japonicum]|uniref:Lipoprotein n=1 Tax=Cryptosporangium japonicum TaxID=80872 RepID=A0ABP3DEX9_9ACTN
MRFPLVPILAAVVACAACTDVSSINETSQDRRSFPLSGSALVVDAAGTSVRLVAGSGEDVGVDRELTGKATADGQASWSMSGNRLTLRVTCSGFVPDCSGLHVVHVPTGTAVTITSDSPVRAVAPSGALTATVTGSWLRVEDPAGVLRLRAEQSVTVTGATASDVTAASESRVELGFRTAPEHVDVQATDRATVTLPNGPETYRVDCACTRSNDPASARTITVRARTAQVRRAA